MAETIVTTARLSITCVLVLLLGGACAPSRGPGRLPIRATPLPLRDAATGAAIVQCLVIPRYTTRARASGGSGHGPGAMAEVVFIARPYVYTAGSPFTPDAGAVKGLVKPAGKKAFTRSSTSIDGVLIVARGYQPVWFDDLWSRSRDLEELALHPIDAPRSLELGGRFLRSIENGRLVGIDRALFSYAESAPIEVRFTDVEHAVVRAFFTIKE